MLGFGGEYPAGYPKVQKSHFGIWHRKSSRISRKKYKEKPILVNFVHLSTAFCTRLYKTSFFVLILYLNFE